MREERVADVYVRLHERLVALKTPASVAEMHMLVEAAEAAEATQALDDELAHEEPDTPVGEGDVLFTRRQSKDLPRTEQCHIFTDGPFCSYVI